VCAVYCECLCVCLFVCCKDYDDLEFSIVSLDGRQWLFEAATLEVCCLSSHSAFLHIITPSNLKPI